MAGRQAKLISEVMLAKMLAHTKRSRTMYRDRVMILLSAKAGLRACEIAGLQWSMVLDGNGNLDDTIAVVNAIAKKKSGRRIPLHPELRTALRALRKNSVEPNYVIYSLRGNGMHANSVVNWFVELFQSLGFEGCSSHSGRRTFITTAARALPRSGGSLRDVQLLAGHRSIETTQTYIDGDSEAQRRLISML